MNATLLFMHTVRKNTLNVYRMSKNPHTQNSERIGLNAFYENGAPPRNPVYPQVGEWLEKNADCYYFTNDEIISASIPISLAETIIPIDLEYDAVYFLIKDEAIIYVGRSKTIMLRQWQHYGKRAHRIAWFQISHRYVENFEKYYIDRIRPIENKKVLAGWFVDELMLKCGAISQLEIFNPKKAHLFLGRAEN